MLIGFSRWPVKPGGQEPFVCRRERCERHNWNIRGFGIFLDPNEYFRPVHVGEGEIHEDHLGSVRDQKCERLLAAPCLERTESCGSKNGAGEPGVRLVVVDDEYELVGH